MVGHAPGWEPWEARRASLPKRPDPETRDARQDARLLLLVVRARFAEGTVPLEHAERLDAVAQDPRVKTRQRRVAASLLAKIRMSALAKAVPAVPQGRDRPTGAGKA